MTSAPLAVLDLEELREVVAKVLDIEVDELTDDADFMDDLEVDSLMALEVVVVLEKKYGVKIPETELKQFTCLAKAYELLLAKVRAS
ncbi:acyl carrier protein [Kitasatospora sp. NPDC058063]|uniref:acyl carrier protein n=1 Tax=unclassified Kitasatospora TaxID=2633591 RepID=UPI0036DA8474